jgi:hypothetical protein
MDGTAALSLMWAVRVRLWDPRIQGKLQMELVLCSM